MCFYAFCLVVRFFFGRPCHSASDCADTFVWPTGCASTEPSQQPRCLSASSCTHAEIAWQQLQQSCWALAGVLHP